jgi:hypothetical protein
MVAENSPQENPFAPSMHTNAASQVWRLDIPATIAAVFCFFWIAFGLYALYLCMPTGQPHEPSTNRVLGTFAAFMILPAVAIAGSVSMLQRKRYGLSVAASICMMIPVFGPCIGLTLPVGIWTLVLLRQQPVRESFDRPFEPTSTEYGNDEDAIAAASLLERQGEWKSAVAQYRAVAVRWPEHAEYVANCIKQIEKKQGSKI